MMSMHGGEISYIIIITIKRNHTSVAIHCSYLCDLPVNHCSVITPGTWLSYSYKTFSVFAATLPPLIAEEKDRIPDCTCIPLASTAAPKSICAISSRLLVSILKFYCKIFLSKLIARCAVSCLLGMEKHTQRSCVCGQCKCNVNVPHPISKRAKFDPLSWWRFSFFCSSP